MVKIMNKDIVLAKIRIREDDLEELKIEKENKIQEFKGFVEKNSIGMLPHIQIMNEVLRISEKILDIYKDIRKYEEEMNDMNQGDDITDDKEQVFSDTD